MTNPSADDSEQAKLDVKSIIRKATELNDFGHLLEHVPLCKNSLAWKSIGLVTS